MIAPNGYVSTISLFKSLRNFTLLDGRHIRSKRLGVNIMRKEGESFKTHNHAQLEARLIKLLFFLM